MNRESTKIRPLNLRGIMKSQITNEWMTLGVHVPTRELKGTLNEQMTTIGVVSALIFTLVSISVDDFGDLDWAGVDTETGHRVFVLVSLLAQAVLLISTMHSMTVFMFVSQLNNTDEVVIWRRQMGKWFDVPYWSMLLGLTLFVASQIWLGASKLDMTYFFTYLSLFLLMIGLIIGQQMLGIHALYQAKYDVAEGKVVEIADDEEEKEDAAADAVTPMDLGA
ncbi:hypothetical protein AB1Y20_011681 [Prymnesium parvum]|uniref:Transmembrane protein 107 n=1 Tax=Prymnesium parvum TaxID=97485 RepID=A0AB34II51_PRYPA